MLHLDGDKQKLRSHMHCASYTKLRHKLFSGSSYYFRGYASSAPLLLMCNEFWSHESFFFNYDDL